MCSGHSDVYSLGYMCRFSPFIQHFLVAVARDVFEDSVSEAEVRLLLRVHGSAVLMPKGRPCLVRPGLNCYFEARCPLF